MIVIDETSQGLRLGHIYCTCFTHDDPNMMIIISLCTGHRSNVYCILSSMVHTFLN
jgi:hypothetical protein